MAFEKKRTVITFPFSLFTINSQKAHRIRLNRRSAHADVRDNAPKHGPARLRGGRRLPPDVVRRVHRQPRRAQRRGELPARNAQAALPRDTAAAAAVGPVRVNDFFLSLWCQPYPVHFYAFNWPTLKSYFNLTRLAFFDLFRRKMAVIKVFRGLMRGFITLTVRPRGEPFFLHFTPKLEKKPNNIILSLTFYDKLCLDTLHKI